MTFPPIGRLFFSLTSFPIPRSSSLLYYLTLLFILGLLLNLIADRFPDYSVRGFGHPNGSSAKPLSVEEVMSSRLKTYNDACRRNFLDQQNFVSGRFIVFPPRKLAWCTVPKTGSTNWANIFGLLWGRPPSYPNTTDKLHDYMTSRARMPQGKLAIYLRHPNTITFLIARHPLERVLSTYKDKILKPTYYYQNIIMRSPLLKGNMTYKFDIAHYRPVPFRTFVLYILREHANAKTLEVHYAPAHRTCQSCAVRISYILKTETLDRDTEFVLRKSGVRGLKVPRKLNPTRGNTREILRRKMKSLGRDMYEALNKLYAIDYELFGYEMLTYDELDRL